MENDTWLAELKVGDKVIVNTSFTERIDTVTKITPTQIHIGEYTKFRKKDGKSIGSSTWNHSWLREYNSEKASIIHLKETHNKILNILRNVSRESVEKLTQFRCNQLLTDLTNFGFVQAHAVKDKNDATT